MRDLRFDKFGGSEVLQIEDETERLPGAWEVRMGAEAIGTGTQNLLMYCGNYPWRPPLPVVPGNKIAEALGASASTERAG